MTPLQLAKIECAKFAFICRECKLAQGEKCRYFETAVAPLANMTSDKKKAESYKGVVKAYFGG